MLRSLIRKTVRDHRRSTLGWGLGMAALTLMQLAVYLNVHSQGAKMRDLINSYPSAFKAMFGMEGVDFTSGLGYLSTETSSLLAPLMLIGLGIALGTGAIATEEEHGTLDLLMASPVSRGRVLAAKALGSFAALIAIATVLYLTVLITANVARRSLPAGLHRHLLLHRLARRDHLGGQALAGWSRSSTRPPLSARCSATSGSPACWPPRRSPWRAVRPPVRCRDAQGPPQRQDLPDGPVGLPVLAGHWRDHSRVGLGRQRLAPQYPQQARHPDTGWPQRLRRRTAVPRHGPARGPCEGVPPGPSLDRSRPGTAHGMALPATDEQLRTICGQMRAVTFSPALHGPCDTPGMGRGPRERSLSSGSGRGAPKRSSAGRLFIEPVSAGRSRRRPSGWAPGTDAPGKHETAAGSDRTTSGQPRGSGSRHGVIVPSSEVTAVGSPGDG